MSELRTETPAGLPDDSHQRQPRARVVVHRLDGGLEDGESDARKIGSEGFPIYSSADSTRARIFSDASPVASPAISLYLTDGTST